MNKNLPAGLWALVLAGSAVGLMSGSAWAQGPAVVSTSPVRNAVNVPTTAAVGITFSQAVSAPSLAGLRVFGNQRRGLRPATISGGGTSTLAVQPQQPFAPGEEVSVSVPASVLGTSGAAATPYVYRFTAAAGPGVTAFSSTGAALSTGTAYCRTVRLADYNQDGNLDIMTLDAQGATIILRLGNGQGGFGAAQRTTVGNSPDYLATADMNNDGKLDVVVTSNGATRAVATWLGDGSGGLTSASAAVLPSQILGLAVADVNGDGNQDVLTSNGAPDNFAMTRTVSVRLGDGTGNLTGSTDLAIGANNCALAVADVNNDGKMDFVLADVIQNTLKTYLGNGTGSFTAMSGTVAVGARPVSLVLTDLNNDGLLDAATANATANTVSVCLGNGAGSFAAPTTLPLTSRAAAKLAAADIDGDGDMDLLAASTGTTGTAPFPPDVVNVLVNNGSGAFTAAPVVGIDRIPLDLATGDINNDGALDIVASNAYDFTLNVLLNQRVLAANAARPELAVSLYPNPAYDVLTLELPAAAGAVSVQLLNALGQPVRSYAPDAGSRRTLPLAGLAAGLYAVRIAGPTGVATRQVVVR